MWRLFKAEFKYNKILIYALIVLLPAIALISSMQKNFKNSLILFWFTFIMLQNWLIKRNREKWEYWYTILPIASWQKGLFRILYIAILCGVYLLIFQAVEFFIDPGKAIDWNYLIIIYLVIIFCFSQYFIMRDLLLYTMRTNSYIRLSRERTRIMLKLSLFAFILAGFVAMAKHSESLVNFIKYLVSINPFTGTYGIIKLSIISTLLVALSVYSYQKRKSSLE